MANTVNNPRTSKQAMILAAKQKTAGAWTITKTMFPTAPHAEQVKIASVLMQLSLPAIKLGTRQTAVNAHWTRVAEQFSQVHKVDLNDLLEDPSVLTKENKAIASELKGDAKSAGAKKKADDRKDAGPLPAEYPEPKRDEPAEMDGSKAGEGRPASWTEAPTGEKMASGKKKACEHGCKGDCDHMKEASSKKKACSEGCTGDCDHMKEASAKTAEEGEAQGEEHGENHEEGGAPQTEVDDEIDAAAEGAAEGAEKAVDGEEGKEGEQEEFDPEITNLEEAAADLEADTARIQDAIAELSGEEGELTFDADAGAGDDMDLFGDQDQMDEQAPMGGDAMSPEGEELNFDEIFDPGAMSDKVSALNDEPHLAEAEAMFEFNDGDDFFAPSDPAELEGVLDQEEGLSSAADMFSVKGIDEDPMAALFQTASKQAAEEAGVVAPGDLEKYFETDLGGDDRDWAHDHEGTIFEDVFMSLKQPKRDDHRDTEPHLKTPGKEAGKKAAAPLRIKQKTASPSAATKVNLASLLFTDESDYL